MVEDDKQKTEAHGTRRGLKNSLHIDSSREFLVFLAFFVIVFFYWYLVNMSDYHEMEYTFDVALKHVPEDVVITEAPTDKVTVTMKDKGEKILTYRARRSFGQLNIDWRDYKSAGSHVVITDQALTELLGQDLSSSTEIINIVPDTIQYYSASAKGKRVPVRLVGSVSADNSHVINSRSLTPDSVTVYAPAVVLDTLRAVRTQSVVLDALSDSVSMSLPFVVPGRGVLVEPSQSTLSVVVTPYVEKTLELPIRTYLFPYELMLKTFPSKAKVTFMVSLDQFHKVSEEQFELVVNYVNLNKEKPGQAHLELVRQPDGIKAVSISPEDVDYLLEQNGN